MPTFRTTNIAILAPVPEDLLEDAVANGFTRVAFGSMAWEFFRGLDEDLPGEPLPVLIYASHQGGRASEAAWTATYERWVDGATEGSDPAFSSLFRPPLAQYDWLGPDGSTGAWAIYWIVRDLRQAEAPIPLSRLRLPDGKPLSSAFVPRGPIRVARPGR